MFSLWTANIDIMKEVDEMTIEERKAMKFLDDWAVKTGRAKEWRQEGRQEERQEIFAFLESGHTLEEAKKKFAFAQ
jgi:hypothetical protein